MYRVCIGYVSGMCRECIGAYAERGGFFVKLDERKIDSNNNNNKQISNIPLTNIKSGKKDKIIIEISRRVRHLQKYREWVFLCKSLAPLAKENPYNTFMQAYVP